MKLKIEPLFVFFVVFIVGVVLVTTDPEWPLGDEDKQQEQTIND